MNDTIRKEVLQRKFDLRKSAKYFAQKGVDIA